MSTIYSNDLKNWNVKQGVSKRNVHLVREHANTPKFCGANSSKHSSILPKTFYERNTLIVSQELLGKVLCFGNIEARIIETEAYVGEDDPACHAAKGITSRTKLMYGSAGNAYVYLIYGMYYCLNIVTEKPGFPAAVLIRGVYQYKPSQVLLDGPGKLCRTLGINKTQNGQDMTSNKSFCVIDVGDTPKFVTTPRIGISKGTDKLWRYLVL